jgi:ferredoxin
MTSMFLERGLLDEAASLLERSAEVWAPLAAPGEDAPRLGRPGEGPPLAIGPRLPLLPLKALFLPRVEELFRFGGGGAGPIVVPTDVLERERVVLGALACDIRSLELLDRVLLAEPADERYRERRERTTLVALACTGESPACFCASLGIDPLRPAGADALLSPAGDGWLVGVLTGKGGVVVERLGPLLRPATDWEIAAAGALSSLSRSDVSLDPPPGGWARVWDLATWEETASRCIACGICTVLCPTCHCFDVQDEKRGPGGARFRVWDTCMSQQFTQMAHGMNPRPLHFSRVRQRFLHKLVYFSERYGAHACVGCGRCARRCPNATGIDEIAARLRAEAGEDGNA